MKGTTKLTTAVILLLALIVGQVHACKVLFVCPDGAVCQTCESSACTPDSGKGDACGYQAPRSADGSCRDCCTARFCDADKDQDDALVKLSLDLDQVAVLPDIPSCIQAALVPRAKLPSHLAVPRSTGPPTTLCLRGPPSLQA